MKVHPPHATVTPPEPQSRALWVCLLEGEVVTPEKNTR
jgi:hypothetical protein